MLRFLIRRPIIALALVYLLIGALFAFNTPDWQAPDEPAHYNYIAQVAANGCCPVILQGDWNRDYLTRLTSTRFHPTLLPALASIQYEDHQPPLYYVLGAAVFRFTNSSLIALRLYSVVLGLGVVLCAYGIGYLMLPQRPWIALGAAALVAFLPQHVHILASVGNDALAELIVALTLLLSIIYVKRLGLDDDSPFNRERLVILVWLVGIIGAVVLIFGGGETIFMAFVLIALAGGGVWLVLYDVRGDAWLLWLLGILVGIGFVTKASTYFLAAVVPLAVVLRWWLDRPTAGIVGQAAGRVLKTAARAKPVQRAARNALKTETGRRFASWAVRRWFSGQRAGELARLLALVLVPMLVLGATWWLRNIAVYGFPDFLGLAAHDQVVSDQPRAADLIAQVGADGYMEQFVSTTFNSFFGQFGWMAVPVLPSFWWLQLAWVALLGAALLGLLVGRSRALRRRENSEQALERPEGQRAAWALLWFTLLLAVLAYLYYNSEFLQFQGRYLFVGLIPFALLIMLGLDVWRRLFAMIAGEDETAARGMLRPYLTTLPILLLAPLDVWLLLAVLVPNLAFATS